MDTITRLNVDDGTLDAFLERRMKETGRNIDDPEKDWGGIFGMIFSDADEFDEPVAERLFQSAVKYGEMLR
jgi:hypothetical protein